MRSQTFCAHDLARCLAEAREGDPAARETFQREIAPLVRVIARRQLRQAEVVLPSGGPPLPRGGPPLPPCDLDSLTRRICRRLLQVVRGETLVGPLRETLPGDKRC